MRRASVPLRVRANPCCSGIAAPFRAVAGALPAPDPKPPLQRRSRAAEHFLVLSPPTRPAPRERGLARRDVAPAQRRGPGDDLGLRVITRRIVSTGLFALPHRSTERPPSKTASTSPTPNSTRRPQRRCGQAVEETADVMGPRSAPTAPPATATDALALRPGDARRGHLAPPQTRPARTCLAVRSASFEVFFSPFRCSTGTLDGLRGVRTGCLYPRVVKVHELGDIGSCGSSRRAPSARWRGPLARHAGRPA